MILFMTVDVTRQLLGELLLEVTLERAMETILVALAGFGWRSLVRLMSVILAAVRRRIAQGVRFLHAAASVRCRRVRDSTRRLFGAGPTGRVGQVRLALALSH